MHSNREFMKFRENKEFMKFRENKEFREFREYWEFRTSVSALIGAFSSIVLRSASRRVTLGLSKNSLYSLFSLYSLSQAQLAKVK